MPGPPSGPCWLRRTRRWTFGDNGASLTGVTLQVRLTSVRGAPRFRGVLGFRTGFVASIALIAAGTTGCASLVTSSLADALSGSGALYAQDDDPELIADAIPFALKTMEGVLVEEPDHVPLLTALCAGFTQYAYAFVSEEADRVEEADYARSEQLRDRAKRLFLRARDFGKRGLEVRHEGFGTELKDRKDVAFARLEKEDVALVYWTAASWALYIAGSGLDPDVVAELPTVRALVERALVLDATFGDGALHELVVSLETAVPGGSLDRAETHYRSAVEMSGGRRAGTFVAYAERICVRRQDRACFDAALKRALSIDVNAYPQDRLANVIMQRRARRLKSEAEDLFVVNDDDASPSVARVTPMNP